MQQTVYLATANDEAAWKKDNDDLFKVLAWSKPQDVEDTDAPKAARWSRTRQRLATRCRCPHSPARTAGRRMRTRPGDMGPSGERSDRVDFILNLAPTSSTTEPRVSFCPHRPRLHAHHWGDGADQPGPRLPFCLGCVRRHGGDRAHSLVGRRTGGVVPHPTHRVPLRPRLVVARPSSRPWGCCWRYVSDAPTARIRCTVCSSPSVPPW